MRQNASQIRKMTGAVDVMTGYRVGLHHGELTDTRIHDIHTEIKLGLLGRVYFW